MLENIIFFQDLCWLHIQACILSHSSTSLQVYLMIFYNILVNTNAPTGIKQICIFYWSAILSKSENFKQSSVKTADNHSFQTVRSRFSTMNIRNIRNRAMQTFSGLLAQMAPLEQAKTTLKTSKFLLFSTNRQHYFTMLKFSSAGPSILMKWEIQVWINNQTSFSWRKKIKRKAKTEFNILFFLSKGSGSDCCIYYLSYDTQVITSTWSHRPVKKGRPKDM